MAGKGEVCSGSFAGGCGTSCGPRAEQLGKTQALAKAQAFGKAQALSALEESISGFPMCARSAFLGVPLSRMRSTAGRRSRRSANIPVSGRIRVMRGNYGFGRWLNARPGRDLGDDHRSHRGGARMVTCSLPHARDELRD